MEKMHRVLVVDESRVVRATLLKYLRDTFEVREECDEESAWQTLVLDSRVCAVICATQSARIKAHALLARLRKKRLPRLQQLPVLLLASALPEEAQRLLDSKLGVFGYIDKAMSRQEILAQVSAAVAHFTAQRLHSSLPPVVHDGAGPVLLKQEYLDDSGMARAIELAMRPSPFNPPPLCALLFGIEARLTTDSATESPRVQPAIQQRLAGLIRSKIGPQHEIAFGQDGCLLIVSRGIEAEQCKRFAERVCRSLSCGSISLGKYPVSLHIGAGIAMRTDGEFCSGQELLQRARIRQQMAMRRGHGIVLVHE